MPTIALPQHLTYYQSQEDSKKNETELPVHRFVRPSMFPITLHKMLQDAEQHDFQDIVSWSSNGGSFKVHKPLEFEDKLMPEYFNLQTKYTSFQRQLNLYGFTRIHQGLNKGSYSHKLFRRQDQIPQSLLVRRSSMTTSTKKFLHDDACAPSTIHSNSLAMSDFDMQTLMDYEAGPKQESSREIPGPFKAFFKTSELPGMTAPAIDEKQTSNMSFSKQKDYRKKAQNGHSFPFMLHDMLNDMEKLNFASIVSWDSDGKSFKVHKQDKFVETIMPLYFDQSKYGSFRRQLNHYSFSRAKGGRNKGRYSHVSFVKGARSLCKHIRPRQLDSKK
jgi:hypothetical protein